MPTLSPVPRRDKPKLLDQVRDVVRRKHYSIRTEQTYVDWSVEPPWQRAKDLAAVHYVYVLRSVTDGGFHIRYSANLRERFKQHSQSNSFATAYRGPWNVFYYEAYLEQSDALRCEKYLKQTTSRSIHREKPREASFCADLHACAEQARHRSAESTG